MGVIQIGGMAVALGGLDALAFTGGVGEGSEEVRERVTALVRFLGEFDVRVVPAREELLARRRERPSSRPSRRSPAEQPR